MYAYKVYCCIQRIIKRETLIAHNTVGWIMSMNAISADKTAINVAPLSTLATSTLAGYGQSPSNRVKSSVADSNPDQNVSTAVKKSSVMVADGKKSKAVREMSHVVETYNLQGEVRIKFMDSNNHVLYQIPSVMVAKIEDQMMKSNSAATIRG